jgi:hypothetical protein
MSFLAFSRRYFAVSDPNVSLSFHSFRRRLCMRTFLSYCNLTYPYGGLTILYRTPYSGASNFL